MLISKLITADFISRSSFKFPGIFLSTIMLDHVQSLLEKLPGEVRNMIFSYTLLAPERKFNIQKIEHRMPASQFFPEPKTRFRKFACMPRAHNKDVCFPLLRLNKSIGTEAIHYLYGKNTFILHATVFEASNRDPSYRSGITEFLSKLSLNARYAIRNVQLNVSQWMLNSTRWHPICAYLAMEMRLVNFQVIVVCVLVSCINRRSMINAQQEEKSSLSALSNLTHPWIQSLVLIQGLDSFSLHTDHCAYVDSGDKDECVPELPDDSDDHCGLRMTYLRWQSEPTYTCFPRRVRKFIREKMGLIRS